MIREIDNSRDKYENFIWKKRVKSVGIYFGAKKNVNF